MIVVRTAAELSRELAAHRDHLRIALVPTMGALHAGHAALLHVARHEGGVVVASVFVNPKQFNDPKDLAAYPRPEEADILAAETAGADYLFIPDATEVYPDGHATSVHIEGAALGFEGDYRPGHFDGVATVCLSLFNIVRPRAAYFGQKDAQQVAVIRQMLRDMHLDIAIHVVPTVRDADGLALSSRNARLSAPDRARALAIPRALKAGLQAYRQGEDPVRAARHTLSGLDADYVGVASFAGEPTLVIAARAGGTRLIDNVPLAHPERAGLGPS